MSKKHKEGWMRLNYLQHFLVLACTITVCISISAFAPFLGVAMVIMSSMIRLKIFSIIAAIRKCNLTIKEKKRKPKEYC